MPLSVNGCGTGCRGFTAPVQWMPSGRPDHDAVVCVTVFWLPILPLKAVHTFDWEGDFCKTLDIRWYPRLLLRAMVLPYVMAAAFGYFLFHSKGREVTLGDGRLEDGCGNVVPLDAVVGVYRRRWIFLVPICAVRTVGSEVHWPRGKKELDDLERVLGAALVLRVPPARKSDATHGSMGNIN